MRTHYLAGATLVAFLFAPALYAQSDFGGSYNLEFSKKLTKQLGVSLDGEYRTRNNFRTTDRFMTTLGADYKLNDAMKVGADYTLINLDAVENKFSDWEVRHRWSVFLTLSKQIGRVSFSLREKYQQTYRQGVPGTEVDSTFNRDALGWEYETKERANPKKVLRTRLQASWDIRKSKFEPYASIEVFHLLNDPVNTGAGRLRYTIGTDYKLTKKDKLTLFYRYNNELTTNRSGEEEDPDSHYIGIGFSHKF
jgi:hypothetical protein